MRCGFLNQVERSGVMRLEDGDSWSQNDGYFSMVNLCVHNSSRPPTWVVRPHQQFHFGDRYSVRRMPLKRQHKSNSTWRMHNIFVVMGVFEGRLSSWTCVVSAVGGGYVDVGCHETKGPFKLLLIPWHCGSPNSSNERLNRKTTEASNGKQTYLFSPILLIIQETKVNVRRNQQQQRSKTYCS
eukprot:scaffold69440_cov96-Cyclotella_meneghiniana.AAC.1